MRRPLVRWLRPTPLLDLEESKLRLRVHALTQLCTSDRQRAVALYRFVKQMPLAKSVRWRARTAREVLSRGRGDSMDKATLAVALLRCAGVPARLHWVVYDGAVLRGLASRIREVPVPLLEVWLDGDWQETDTYIFDARLMAAVRQRLRDAGWDFGFGIRVDGHMLWNGHGSAYAGGTPDKENPFFKRELGCFDDPAAFLASPAFRGWHSRMGYFVLSNALAPQVSRTWRKLRDGLAPA